MLQFFRINDQYRILFVGLLLLVIRVPLLIISSEQWTLNELNWLTAADFLNNGNVLYKTLLTDLSPFAAWTYQLIDMVFGQSRLAYFILSFILIITQAFVFNALLLTNKVYNENTYIPALLYAIFMSYHFDTLTLSPVLLGMTFVLLAINNVFKRLDQTTGDDLFSITGVYLATASLFYFPFIFFLPATLISLLVLSNPKPRRIILLLFSFVQIYVLVGCYFYFKDAHLEYLTYFFSSNLTFHREYLVPFNVVITSALPLIIITLLVTVNILFSSGYVNNQRRVFYAILIFQLFGLMAMLFTRKISPSIMLNIAIAGSFFFTHYLLKVRKRWRAELILNAVLLTIVIYSFLPFMSKTQKDQYDSFYIIGKQTEQSVTETRLLVLSNESSLYRYNTFAGDFLDWKLSEPIFRKVQSIDNLVRIEEAILRNKPQVIVDPSGYMDAIMEIVPSVGNQYERSLEDPAMVLLRP